MSVYSSAVSHCTCACPSVCSHPTHTHMLCSLHLCYMRVDYFVPNVSDVFIVLMVKENTRFNVKTSYRPNGGSSTCTLGNPGDSHRKKILYQFNVQLFELKSMYNRYFFILDTKLHPIKKCHLGGGTLYREGIIPLTGVSLPSPLEPPLHRPGLYMYFIFLFTGL